MRRISRLISILEPVPLALLFVMCLVYQLNGASAANDSEPGVQSTVAECPFGIGACEPVPQQAAAHDTSQADAEHVILDVALDTAMSDVEPDDVGGPSEDPITEPAAARRSTVDRGEAAEDAPIWDEAYWNSESADTGHVPAHEETEPSPSVDQGNDRGDGDLDAHISGRQAGTEDFPDPYVQPLDEDDLFEEAEYDFDYQYEYDDASSPDDSDDSLDADHDAVLDEIRARLQELADHARQVDFADLSNPLWSATAWLHHRRQAVLESEGLAHLEKVIWNAMNTAADPVIASDSSSPALPAQLDQELNVADTTLGSEDRQLLRGVARIMHSAGATLESISQHIDTLASVGERTEPSDRPYQVHLDTAVKDR